VLRNIETSSPKILYRDNYICLAYKPRGLSFDTEQVNLIGWVGELAYRKVYPVHRLDKDVDGICVFGLSPYVASRLNEQFVKREVLKIYVGILKGNLDKTVLIKRPIKRKKKVFPAETFIKPLSQSKGLTLVSFQILTGRFHQIKKHVGLLKMSFLTDSVGVILSSVALGFTHPRTKRKAIFSCIKQVQSYKTWKELCPGFRLTRKLLLS